MLEARRGCWGAQPGCWRLGEEYLWGGEEEDYVVPRMVSAEPFQARALAVLKYHRRHPHTILGTNPSILIASLHPAILERPHPCVARAFVRFGLPYTCDI